MDVEAILDQIRERVVSEQTPQALDVRSTEPEQNGSGLAAEQDEALSRIESHLLVTRRAADRLPPVLTNRHGLLARIEVWIKKASRPLTRWFVWEQINFNRAVNDALVAATAMLQNEARELATLRAQIAAEAHQLRSEVAGRTGQLEQLEARLEPIEARMSRLESRIGRLEPQIAQFEPRLAVINDNHSRLLAEHTKLAREVVEVVASIRSERDAALAEFREEQRVCFRQLSLEASESAVLEDRARRELLTRLENLEKTSQPPNK